MPDVYCRELDTSDVDSNEGIDSNIKVVYDIFNSDTRYILKVYDKNKVKHSVI